MRRLAALALLCGLVACSSASPPTADGGATSSGQADTSPGSGAASASTSASTSASPSASTSAPASSPAAAAPYVGPVFSAPTLDGGFLSDADVAGRPTVMWFWAPWCGVCQEEAPQVAEAARELDGEAVVVGVGGFGEAGAMREFVAERGLEGIPHLEDPAGRVWGAFGVVGQPTTVFMDAAGTVVVVPGALTAEEIVDRARALASA